MFVSRRLWSLGRGLWLHRSAEGTAVGPSVELIWHSSNLSAPDAVDHLHAPAPVGQTLLEVAHQHGVPLEGACEGSCACSTCHVILDQHIYDLLPEPSDEENDMLDMAYGLTETSRLGCQCKVIPQMQGTTILLPAATRNFAVDGFKPKPH